MNYFGQQYCLESVRIRTYSGPYFPAFGLNTERYSYLQMREIRARITPNTDTFYAVQETFTLLLYC